MMTLLIEKRGKKSKKFPSFVIPNERWHDHGTLPSYRQSQIAPFTK